MPEIKDVYSRHAHFLEQYYNGEANKIAPFLNKVAKDLRIQLTKTNTVTSKARIKHLLDFTEDLVKGQLTTFTGDLNGQIELFADSEAEFASLTIEDQPGVVNVITPGPAQLHAAVNARTFNNALLKDTLKSFSADQARMVRDAVSMGFFEGKTTQDIIRTIVGTKSQNFKNGILNVTRTSAERIVRTALNHTASVAKNKTFEDNSDLIPYYEWVSTLDGRTSAICRSRDGNAYKVNKGPLPPAHPNCRSTTSPLFKEDVTVKGDKLTKDNADLNYNDWLDKQSKSFQVDVLGPTRAELFRKGGLTMDKFVNNRGQTLTLDQLKTKYPKAWGKI